MPCAMIASVGSAMEANGSVVVGEQTTDTPPSPVRVNPSPACRAIDTFRRSRTSTAQVKHPGAPALPPLAGSCKRSAASFYHLEHLRWCHGVMTSLDSYIT